MIGDLIKAVRQLLDPRFRRVFLLSTLMTIGLLAVFYYAALWLLEFIPNMGFSLFGYEISFFDDAVGWLAQGAVIWLLAVLMFPVAALFIGLFLEEIADAVEDKHYPHLPQAGRMTYWEILTDGLEFTLTLIGANMIGLIFYLFSGPLAPFIFLAINGYLLGRQYFELVGARRIGIAEAKRLRGRRFGRVWLAGILMSIPLSIPGLNVIVPVLGVASFTHMFHRLDGMASAE